MSSTALENHPLRGFLYSLVRPLMKATETPDDASAVETKTVLFVDLLGFASLTEAHPIQPALMRASERPLSAESLNFVFSSTTENPLSHNFASFHRSLRSVLYVAQMQYPLTAITFSDSAFIATTQVYEAARIAVDLQQLFLRSRVPVRMGMAHGSFLALRFRSDVAVDGGDHASHFLGTGVVRAYAAERCGIKGLRILVHPSAMLQLAPTGRTDRAPATNKAILITSCTDAEGVNGTGVRDEINYWAFSSAAAESDAWRTLQGMWTNAPVNEKIHYESTAAAINRMRIQHGHEPLTDLRRRSLWRKRRAAV